MAKYAAYADGNLSGAGAVWAVIDSTSFNEGTTSQSFFTNLTTSYAESSTFTPGAITVDGIAVKVQNRSASPVGTMSCRLAQAGVLVAGTEVSINVSDIPLTGGSNGGNDEIGWVFFKFSAPVLLVAATLYSVSLKTSTTAMVGCSYVSSSTNWTRLLRTTATGTPGAGDDLYVLGEWTAAATKTNRVVTMDGTASTDFGSDATFSGGLTVNLGGTFKFGNAASTAYRFKVSGLIWLHPGAIFTIGTVANPIPSTSTALLEIDSASGGFGIVAHNATVTMQGSPRTAGKPIVKCLLNTDEAVAQTTLGVDTDTGWKSGDEIAIAGTDRTDGHYELRTLNADAGASSLVVTSGLTYAHSGTSPTQADVILLTRNITVINPQASNTWIYTNQLCVVDFDWVRFEKMGQSGVSSAVNAGSLVTDMSTGGSMNVDYCAFKTCSRILYTHSRNLGTVTSGYNPANIAFRNCVGYAASVGNGGQFTFNPYNTYTAEVNIILEDITLIAGHSGIVDYHGGITINRISISGTGNQNHSYYVALTNTAMGTQGHRPHYGTTRNLRIYSGTQSAVIFGYAAQSYKIVGLTAFRMGTGGGVGAIRFLGGPGMSGDVELEDVLVFGTNGSGMSLDNDCYLHRVTVTRGVFAGDSSFAQSGGFDGYSSQRSSRYTFKGCTFGVASGIFVAHSSFDISLNDTGGSYKGVELDLVGCTLASTTKLTNYVQFGNMSRIRYQNSGGANRVIIPRWGTVSEEGTTIHGGKVGEKLEPTEIYTSNFTLHSGHRRFPVLTAGAPTIGVWVRKSSAYNGIAPRLILRATNEIGVTTDVVVATLTVGADTWEQLTGVMPAATANGAYELYVDATGSLGAVYVSDWSRS